LRIDPDKHLAEQADSFLLFGQQGADRATLHALCGSASAEEFSIRELEDADVYLDTPVPPRPEDFVGRSEDLCKVLAVLRSRRAGVVYGPEGIGKSALALELAHFASAPGRLFSCSTRIISLTSDKLLSVVGTFEEALEAIAEELHIPIRLWSAGSKDSSFGSQPPSSRCSTASFDDSGSFDEPPLLSPGAQEDFERLLPARLRLRRGFQLLEKRRRSARTLLIVDDQAGAISKNPELRQLLGELLDSTYRLHMLVCSREPVYDSLGQTKAVNVPLAGLGEQDAARLLLQRVHRLLLPVDFVPPDKPPPSGGEEMSPAAASILPESAASPTSSPSPGGTGVAGSAGGTGNPQQTMDEALRRLRGHALLRGLGGNPGAIRAVGARVHDGGPTLAEIAATMPHEIPSAAAMCSPGGVRG
jgi:hypothetical protein